MMAEFIQNIHYILLSFVAFLVDRPGRLFYFVPMLILFEAPLFLIVISGVISWFYHTYLRPLPPLIRFPPVTCIITCYGEGQAIKDTIISLCEQVYLGDIEIIPVIDGAVQNRETFQAGLESVALVKKYQRRTIKLLPKWQRGGRVSSLNSGLHKATGEIVFALDGDSSFDNTMIYQIVKEFQDPNVPAVGGALRVRNYLESLVTRMQSLEYNISIQAGKSGLAQWNLLNNISGAFGAFRLSFIKQIGGWDTHTAEDLDLTLRIRQYAARHPAMHIPFATFAIGHTDAPTTWKGIFLQRLRWDGDLVFLFLRKHKYGLSPKILGWKSYLFILFYGILQNLLLPLLILFFNVWIVIFYPMPVAVGLLLIQYVGYLTIAVFLYLFFILTVSERPKRDLTQVGWLLFYPIYSFIMRLFTVVTMLNEGLRRGHEESSMAPWWVLKRGEKF